MDPESLKEMQEQQASLGSGDPSTMLLKILGGGGGGAAEPAPAAAPAAAAAAGGQQRAQPQVRHRPALAPGGR